MLKRNKQIVNGEMRCTVKFEREECEELRGSSPEKSVIKNILFCHE
ncbi:MAG: hypothetical protein QXW01_03090 [Candidatus Aenigmatarchaeota archaeon]